MLTDADYRSCAARLLAAARTGRPIAPLTREFPGMTIQDAYRVQDRWLELRLAEGARMTGYKIGLTSAATQTLYGATEPMYGRILEDGILRDGARVPRDAFCTPRLEVELAFILGADIQESEVDIEQVLQATARVVPAFEIVAQRTDGPRKLVDAIADNAAFGAIVRGAEGSRLGAGTDAGDLASIDATLYRNEAHADSGISSSAMGHPAAAVAWLARALHASGRHLERGQIILTGTLTPAVEVAPGDVFRAEYGALGSLGVSFD